MRDFIRHIYNHEQRTLQENLAKYGEQLYYIIRAYYNSGVIVPDVTPEYGELFEPITAEDLDYQLTISEVMKQAKITKNIALKKELDKLAEKVALYQDVEVDQFDLTNEILTEADEFINEMLFEEHAEWLNQHGRSDYMLFDPDEKLKDEYGFYSDLMSAGGVA
jgi:hypothetical protein